MKTFRYVTPVIALTFALYRSAFCEDDAKSEPKFQENFDVNQYLGKWYEIGRTKSIPFQGGTDITATYSLKGDGKINVLNRQWLPDKNKWETVNGLAWNDNKDQPAQLKVKFSWLMPAGDYRVFRTDYENFSLVVSDVNFLFGLIRHKWAWILARTPRLPEAFINECLCLFRDVYGIDPSEFALTQHGVAP